MTTIAAARTANLTWIGGDSAVTIDETIVLQDSPKVFLAGGVAWGCCGVTAWEHGLKNLDAEWSGGRTTFKLFVEQCLTPKLVELIQTIPEDVRFECAAVFGARGSLFYVEGDALPWAIHGSYHAIGYGAEVALGVLHVTDRVGYGAERRILSALKAAAEHTDGTRAPFHSVFA